MFEGQRLGNANLKQYTNNEQKILDKYIYNVPTLLQSDYGDINDCVLVSIASLIIYLNPQLDIMQVYNQITLFAKKYGYRPTFGTPNIMIKTILEKSLEYFQLPYKTKNYYIKNLGFDYQDIKDKIDNNLPILLTIWRDGRNFYKNHNVIISGYYYTQNYKLLAIKDNWYKTNSYLDYNKLNCICNIYTIQHK